MDDVSPIGPLRLQIPYRHKAQTVFVNPHGLYWHRGHSIQRAVHIPSVAQKLVQFIHGPTCPNQWCHHFLLVIWLFRISLFAIAGRKTYYSDYIQPETDAHLNSLLSLDYLN